MRSNSQAQRFRSVSPQFGKSSSWILAVGMALLAVFLSTPARAAIFTVNSTSDVAGAAPFNDGICATAYNNGVPNGVCTLRAAIQEANALPGADEIILPSLPPGAEYLLTLVTELQITDDLTITGGGASTTIINGNKGIRPDSRVLTIVSGTVTISGVTVRNGAKTSGQEGGGGIFNGGTLILTDSKVTENSFNPALPGGLFAPFFDGGGINNSGMMTLINSTVSLNSITTPPPLSNSASLLEGGGIENDGTLTLINSTVSGNTFNGVGGQFDATEGGGISNFGTLTLINSTVSGNTSDSGGQFDAGGGIYNYDTLTLINSAVSGNSAGVDGGGIYNNSGTMTLANSTVSSNTAGQSGGGVYNITRLVTPAVANLFNVTIANNRADADLNGSGSGGGVFNQSVFNFENTIIAGNRESVFSRLFIQWIATAGDCAGTITSNGNNLLGIVNCTVIGSLLPIADPKLGPLQNNGGPTQTHALLAGSPAIDAGNPAGCRDNLGALLTTDQRGFPRPPVGCDIGAYEVFTGSTTSVVAALLPSSRSVRVNTPATAFATIINTGQEIAAGCSITPLTNVAASFQYQATDPATNQITGNPNTPVNIAAGAAQSFVLALTPTAAFPPTDVQFNFDCANTDPAPINVGLNTLLLSASLTPVPDVVALAATTTSDGIVNIPGTNGTGAFAVATVNVGASGNITASADTGSAALPVTINLCQTEPATGACISGIGPSVTTTINANATPTFGIFVQGNGTVPFDPAANRIFVRFKDGGGVTRGSTSVAVRTQ
jgi:CSLREA domain-containing protein